jgi:hypothetical protein
MSTLLDALKNGDFGIGGKIASDFDDSFANKVPVYRDAVVNDYFRYNTDLNQSIAKIAVKDNLNDDQIQRIIEEVNNQVYLIKYNQMKSSPDREVEFNLASLPQIKDCFKSTDLISNKAAEQNSNGESIEKKAGWSDGGKEDKINFLNYNAYDTVSLSVEMCSKEQIEKKANEKKMERLNKECSESLKKCAGEFYEIADAMIKLDRHNMDTQDIFAQLCKQANLMKLDQLTIKNAITQKVAQLKDYRKISDGYDFNVDLVNIEKAANEFSLGEYSFLDKQVKTASNSDMPIIVTDGNRVIKNVSDLVKLAMDAKQNQLKAKSAYNDLSVIASKTK